MRNKALEGLKYHCFKYYRQWSFIDCFKEVVAFHSVHDQDNWNVDV